MDDKNYSVPPGYTVVDGSMEDGFLKLQSPFGSEFMVSFDETQTPNIEELTSSPFNNDFGIF